MRQNSHHKRGVALVLSLVLLVIITVLIVGLSSIMTVERSSARGSWDHQRAAAQAEMARDHAIALLRDGIEGGRAATNIWASQPGRITVFNTDGTVNTALSRDLFTGTNLSLPFVDLNQATFSGNNPIASGSSIGTNVAPTMPVNWVNVPQDPRYAAASTNAIVGRYAFWVDDDSSKINVNTADGTSSRYVYPAYSATASSNAVSYGPGMPTEVSLQALTNSIAVANITPSNATNIASFTGVRPGLSFSRNFSSPEEILQLANMPSKVFQDNNFDLTHYDRSPELNIFGEPKIYLMTAANTNATATPANLSIGPYPVQPSAGFPNGGLPIRQIYPSSNPLTINYAYAPQAYIGNSVTQTGIGNQLPPFKNAPPFNTYFNTFAGYPINSSPANLALPQYFAYYKHDLNNLTQFTIGNFPGTYWDGNNGGGYYFYNYMLGVRIAQYLKGYNSQGNTITWPPFSGTKPDSKGVTGFAGKYTDRQIDSITLQLMDMLSRNNNLDVNPVYGELSSPMILPHGFLSPLPAKGLGRMPCLNQVLLTFTTSPGNPPQITVRIDLQWWYPKGYKGLPPYDGVPNFYYNNTGINFINVQDTPTGAVSLGGYEPKWACQMLNIKDPTDPNPATNDSGVDLMGDRPDQPDPDPVASQTFHPNLAGLGSGPVPTSTYQYASPLTMLNPVLASSPNPPISWTPGDFRCVTNRFGTTAYNMRWFGPGSLPKLTKIQIGGGIAVWAEQNNENPFPLDSIRGSKTGEDLTDPKVRAAVLAAVLPMPTNPPLVLPVSYTFGDPVWVGQVLLKVADPLVDNMPGDWTSEAITQNPLLTTGSTSDITLTSPSSIANEYLNGANPEFQAGGGGDPDSYWLPEMNENIPKSQRFPSVGYMQYIRTGLMPDKATDVSGNTNDASYIAPTDPSYVAKFQAQHGTPFRLISLAPSYDPTQLPTIASNPGQTTAGGGSYPDWAMLDLFTSPVSPQPLQGTGVVTPPYMEMTYGGSTPGRVNVNGASALVPFGGTYPRVIPLQAAFKGVQAGYTYSAPSVQKALENSIPTTVDEKALAAAIYSYQTNLVDSNGVGRPFLMPEEIANVPAVYNYAYDGTHNSPATTALPRAAISRNDLLRQTLGNLTTQSNTFSVWAVGQSVKQLPNNTLLVLGEARTHYIVERYIDLGTDGVPGNASSTAGSSGADGIVGTPDDVIDGDDTPGHIIAGANPKMVYPLPYKYRVIKSEEITN